MVKESNILKDVMLAASQLKYVLFRNNTAMAGVGIPIRSNEPKMMMVGPGDVLLKNARPLHAGLCKGSSDLIGWNDRGLFTAIECKTDSGRVSFEQSNFIQQVKKAGGIAGIARSADDVANIIHQSTNPLQ